MSDDAGSIPAKGVIQGWYEAWKTCIQNVLSQVSGQPNAFEIAREPLTATESDLHYVVTVSDPVRGEMALRLATTSALRLACKFLGEPDPKADAKEEAINEEKKEALEELFRQIAGLVATSVGGIAGAQIQLQLSAGEAAWSGNCDQLATLHTRDDAGTEIAIEIRLSPALVSGLESREALADKAASTAASAASGAAGVGGLASPPAQQPTLPASLGEPTAALGRLFGVELGVKLRFGIRNMLLRDVLALSSGLVVELDNKLNSPVDLLLDGRVIAHGDVVVIDGKYGLRVTEVLDPALPLSG